MNPKLMEAVAIFRDLGWETATKETVLQLPMGTPEQKRTALAGLKSGGWGRIAEIAPNAYGYRSYLDVDEGMLAVFAVRAGVDARRAANLLRAEDSRLLADVIAARGAAYAADFIACACVSRRRLYEHSASAFGSTAVRLVDQLNLEIPKNVEYLKDWAVYAAAAMGLKAEVRYRETELPDLPLIQRRFAAHIRTGVAVGAPATGPFGAVLPAGVTQGWLSREEAVALIFSALDAAVRPGTRKVWLSVLDELGVGDQEFCARTQSLIPLLATGETAVTQRLAPVLIAGAEDSQLTEVLLSALPAASKKAQLSVLKAALGHARPEDAQALTPWLSALAAAPDQTIASTAARLMGQWGLDPAPPEEDTHIQNLWQRTPPVWTVPAFTLGECSPEALTDLAAEVVRRPALVHDILTERFFAVANAVAYADPGAARTSLRGLPAGKACLFDFLLYWVEEEAACYGFDRDDENIQPLLTARDHAVCQQLDALPCLLSTPSFDDLSITVNDLAARLLRYEQAGALALEADLLLALTRLDGRTSTPDITKALQKRTVPVALQSGKAMPRLAGEIILHYLDAPIQEPPIIPSKSGHWVIASIEMPESLADFPNRYFQYTDEPFSIFPLWGDAALDAVRWDSEVYHERGLVLRQVVRRASPLPPGGAINLLAAQRSTTPDAAADAMLAVTEAWSRGLLRPGVADVAFLDWRTAPPSNLAALSAALDGVIRDETLSVVWPILDELIAASLKAPRLLAGTAELAQLLLTYLPEVEAAVQRGDAAASALDLPGIRTLARRGGSSRAVRVAQQVAQLLPSAQTAAPASAPPAAMEPPFESVWPAWEKARRPIEDGVCVAVACANPGAPTKLFLFTLTLPGIVDQVFQVVNLGWSYDLEHEGQCKAYAVPSGTTTFSPTEENQVWLHWDTQKNAVVVCKHRNWVCGHDGPLSGIHAPPLPASLLTVVTGLLAQDGDAVYFAPRLLQALIEEGQMGAETVRNATRTLLHSPVVSPAKLVRTLEKNLSLLPVLWPMLTEGIKAAGAQTVGGCMPPVWASRVLDVTLRYAPYLAQARKRGLIPQEDSQWTGLREIASSKAKSVSVTKAKKLLSFFYAD